MFKSISVNGFRCFDDFAIDSLARVNLIAGRNSVGKTALLEAIFLLIGAQNLNLVLKISSFRGITRFGGDLQSIAELLWIPLFHRLDMERTISISGDTETGRHHKVELSMVPATSQMVYLEEDVEPYPYPLPSPMATGEQILRQEYTDPAGQTSTFDMKIAETGLVIQPAPPSPPFPGYFLSARRSLGGKEEADLLGRLVKSKHPRYVVDALKIVEKRLSELAVVPTADIPTIFGDIGLDQMLPIYLLGDGMALLMSVLLRMAVAAGGVVLVDEIENGLHHSILRDVWRAIGSAASTFGTQVFATTHSYECIREAHEAFKEGREYDFRLHRLDWEDDKVTAVTYDEEALAAALKTDFEVR